MSKSITVNLGIFDAIASVVQHRNGDVTMRYPQIKWINNTGSLKYEKIRFSGEIAKKCVNVFNGTEMVSDNDTSYPMSYGEFFNDYVQMQNA